MSRRGELLMVTRVALGGPGRAKASLPALVGPLLEESHVYEMGLRRPHEDELGDPHANLDLELLFAVVVDEGHHELSAITGVYEPGRVDEGDPVARREPAPREDEARVPIRDGDRYPRADDGPPARLKHGCLSGGQVVAGVPGVGAGRRSGFGA